jgi:gamma-glutamylcyclotransferase (GGCT)/AIG2-like uncharacterized protein YtfP
MPDSIRALFVYGTLQRGQCREKFWPHLPEKIEPAVARGQLHDLGPYPALVEGSDRIGGELWHIRPEHVAETLSILDGVEDAAVGETGLYVRRVVTVETADGQSQKAFAYFYTRPAEVGDMPIVTPDADGICRWRAMTR